jgi:hypothetical protein
MTRRKIDAVVFGDVIVTVYRDADWNEFQAVITMPIAQRNPDATYFTDDKEDAMHTALKMAKSVHARMANVA